MSRISVLVEATEKKQQQSNAIYLFVLIFA
jgi:hypothetical protein